MPIRRCSRRPPALLLLPTGPVTSLLPRLCLPPSSINHKNTFYSLYSSTYLDRCVLSPPPYHAIRGVLLGPDEASPASAEQSVDFAFPNSFLPPPHRRSLHFFSCRFFDYSLVLSGLDIIFLHWYVGLLLLSRWWWRAAYTEPLLLPAELRLLLILSFDHSFSFGSTHMLFLLSLEGFYDITISRIRFRVERFPLRDTLYPFA